MSAVGAKVFGVVGWKNSGKTTLTERLVAEIVGRGVTVSTIKHAHHWFDVDHEGKDSWRHREAGAREVLVSSGARWALMHELRGKDEPSLEAHLTRLAPVDLVLVEGVKFGAQPKIEAHRVVNRRPLLAPDDPMIRAIASDAPLPEAPRPRFDLNDVAGIASFILAESGLTPNGPGGGAPT